MDEFRPLNLQPQPGGRAWARRGKPRRIRATYTRPHGVRHLLSALDVGRDRLYGHIKPRKRRVEFLGFVRYLRSLYPPHARIHLILDNLSVHKGDEVRQWAEANNLDLAYTPHYSSWLNRIEAQFKALRYFCLNGTNHPVNHRRLHGAIGMISPGELEATYYRSLDFSEVSQTL